MIKEFVALPPMSSHELSERFTLSTCEVEEVIETGRVLTQTFVARITAVEAHPNADKLRLVSFDAGAAGTGRLSAGPRIVRWDEGPLCPGGYDPAGGFYPGTEKDPGVVSEGMLCAEDELGLSAAHEGLMELERDARRRHDDGRPIWRLSPRWCSTSTTNRLPTVPIFGATLVWRESFPPPSGFPCSAPSRRPGRRPSSPASPGECLRLR